LYVYKCRIELQDPKHSARESKNVPTTIKLSEIDVSHEPTYEVVGGTQMVKLTPNPAYGTSLQGEKQDIEITPNPAYDTTNFTVKNAEDPGYI